MTEQETVSGTKKDQVASSSGSTEASTIQATQSPAIAASFDFAPVPPTVSGPKGRCPRCGQGHLFKGYLSLNESCKRCGLDFSYIDTGDGPAVFVIFIVSIIIVAAAIAVEFMFMPPIWLHILIWWPLIIVLCLTLLRPLKGLMIALQYAQKAHEGQRVNQRGGGDGDEPSDGMGASRADWQGR